MYKVVAYEKDNVVEPKIKISGNIDKLTNPGFKKVIRFYDNETGQAIADILALKDEVIDLDEYILFDPTAPWKQKKIQNYHYKELQVPMFVNGVCVYEMPSTLQVREYCQKQMATLWDEVKRQRYPHRYYVDYSEKLFNLKNELIKKNTIKL